MGKRRLQFRDISRQFTSEWHYYKGFVLSSIEIQKEILIGIYNEQTDVEKALKETVYKNNRGFAQGNPALRFSELAEKILVTGVSWQTSLNWKDKSDMRLLHRYFPQYIGLLESHRKTEQLSNLMKKYMEYADKCRELEKDIKKSASDFPELKDWGKALIKTLREGKYVEDARNEYLMKLAQPELMF